MSVRTLVLVAVARGLQLAAAHVAGRMPIGWDDPLVLRWWRLADEHPVRTWVALACLLVAVAGGAPSQTRTEDGKCL